MNNEIMSIIKTVYLKKDYEFFIRKCKEVINLPHEITTYLGSCGFDVIEFHEICEPSKKWCIKLGDFRKDEFKVSYCTNLEVSKIGPFFYVQHEFAVPNLDERRIEQTLDGFSSQPYSMEQASLYDKIVEEFTNLGYYELSYREMNEVVNIDFDRNLESIYGEQLTVEALLFHDILELSQQ